MSTPKVARTAVWDGELVMLEMSLGTGITGDKKFPTIVAERIEATNARQPPMRAAGGGRRSADRLAFCRQ